QQQRLDELQDPDLHQLLKRIDIGGHPRYQDTGLLTVVEGHRQPQQVLEDTLPQIAKETLADPADVENLITGGDVADQRDDDVHHHGDVEGAAIAGGDPLVDTSADE